MSKGVLGPTIDNIPVGGGTAIVLKDGSRVPGAGCEIHGWPAEHAALEFPRLIARTGGVDVCPACLERVREFVRVPR